MRSQKLFPQEQDTVAVKRNSVEALLRSSLLVGALEKEEQVTPRPALAEQFGHRST